MTGPASGYHSAAYAASLAALGRIVPLGKTGGFVIEREIAGSAAVDLMGPYPLFSCTHWDALGEALAGLGADAVSLTLVTDPFCPLSAGQLAAIFPLCRPLHDHYLIDLDAPPALSRHHQRKLRGAGAVELRAGPAQASDLDDWARLYEVLIARKSIEDLRKFDRESFRHQLSVPGAHLVSAWEQGEMLGADLYYPDRGRVFAHLSAYSDTGYAQSVSYPMMGHAIEYFRGKAEFIDLGGVPAGAASGLSEFKAGWTAVTRPSHLCGKVLNPARYAELCKGLAETAYFPAYRQSDFKR
jgi:hypothetical protein